MEIDAKTFIDWLKYAVILAGGPSKRRVFAMRSKSAQGLQNKFLLLEDFKQGLSKENGLPILRNNKETNSQLMRAGLKIKEFKSKYNANCFEVYVR